MKRVSSRDIFGDVPLKKKRKVPAKKTTPKKYKRKRKTKKIISKSSKLLRGSAGDEVQAQGDVTLGSDDSFGSGTREPVSIDETYIPGQDEEEKDEVITSTTDSTSSTSTSSSSSTTTSSSTTSSAKKDE